MTENFCFRGKLSLFAFIGMKQRFCILIRNAAGNIGWKSIVVYHNELSIEHGLGIRYCLEDSQHLFIDAHPDALLYHQVLDKLAPGSINSSDADGTVVIQDLLSREKGVLPLDQPADISGYKAAEEQNSVLSCPLGDDFFGVPLKIFLCFHHDSSCIDKPHACIVLLRMVSGPEHHTERYGMVPSGSRWAFSRTRPLYHLLQVFWTQESTYSLYGNPDIPCSRCGVNKKPARRFSPYRSEYQYRPSP